MKSHDKALLFFTVVAIIIIGFYVFQESPYQKATKEYNKQLKEQILRDSM